MNTPEKAKEIKRAIAAILAFFTAPWGWIGWVVVIWAFCMLLDYISGTAAARRKGEWSSAIARDGLWHKLGEIFAVLVAALADIALGIILDAAPVSLPFTYSTFITPLVLLWYIITELGSILENAVKLGAQRPEWLLKRFKIYRDTLDAVQGGKDHPPDEEPENKE